MSDVELTAIFWCFKGPLGTLGLRTKHTHTQPWRKYSRMHFYMFLAKLWLLLLMITTKHAEPHTHTTWRLFPEGMLHGRLPLFLLLLPAADWGQTDAPLQLKSLKDKLHPKPLKPSKSQLLVVCSFSWLWCQVDIFPACWQKMFCCSKTIVIVRVWCTFL